MLPKTSTLILFGATGDLAARMLLPSLYGLDSDKLLPEDLRIFATARGDHDDDGFRAHARHALEENVPANFFDAERAERFLERLHYVPLDARDTEGFKRLAAAVGDKNGDIAIFLSTAPSLFEPTIDGLAAAGLAGAACPARARKAARHRPRLEPRDQRCRRPTPFPRTASSGSTIISARKRSRTCSRCASPT